MGVIFKIFDKRFPYSTGVYRLNRFKDNQQLFTVQNNHLAIVKEMAADHMLMLNHVYGTRIIDADFITDFSIEPDADAAITTKPGILLSVQTADCVPVLLTSLEENVIGAAHCSWHTAKDNILMLLVRAMQDKGAKQIRAIIGPAINQKSYEVDQLFYDKILAAEPNATSLFIPSINEGHAMFDMPAFCRMKLNQLGIIDILDYCEDTYTHPEKYPSYRRDTHQGIRGAKNNILSTIMIKP